MGRDAVPLEGQTRWEVSKLLAQLASLSFPRSDGGQKAERPALLQAGKPHALPAREPPWPWTKPEADDSVHSSPAHSLVTTVSTAAPLS